MRTSVSESPDTSPAAALPGEAARLEPENEPYAQPPARASHRPPSGAKRSSGIASVALAATCAVHCVAAPIVALLPMGSMFASSAAEWLVPAGALVLAGVVLAADYRMVHGRRAPAAVLAIAAALLATGHALDEMAIGTAIALTGSASLGLAMLVNLRHRREHHACHEGTATRPDPAAT